MKRDFLFFFALLFPNLFLLGQDITYVHSAHHSFLENKGQWNKNVLFKHKMNGGNLWVEQNRLLFQLLDYSELHEVHFSAKEIKKETVFREKLVQMEFLNSTKPSAVIKKGETKHYYNYFIGNDESKWASGVHGYEEFILKGIYPGIDIRFVEQRTQIKYEFQVAPNVSPDKIQLKYTGQDQLKINRAGDLLIKTELGDIIEEKPYAYQIVNGKIIEIPCDFEIKNNLISFKLGEYNKKVTLIIDPTLVFATYCGAVSDNFGMTATYGHDGSAYSAGTVYGNSYPTPDANAFDTQSNLSVTNVGVITTDAFITKYSDDGTTMLWSTFYGGGDNTQGTDVPHSLICDLSDNIYVFGTTSSLDFPIVNGFQNTFGGGTPISISYNGTNFGMAGTDIYVAKFSSNGHQLLGSTYVGGSQNDGVNYMISSGNYTNVQAYDSLTMNYGDQFRGEIMLDAQNNIIVGSCTRSNDFPTQNSFQNSLSGQQDGVIFKIKNDFSSLLFSSYFGGAQADAIYSAKVDSQGNIIFGGGTTSTDLNTTIGVYQATYNGGKSDGFIGKLSPNGSVLTHSTYVGTNNYDQVFFVEVDKYDNVYIFGQSNGGNFPVINSAFSNFQSSQFIAKFPPDLSSITQSTVFGSGSSTFDLSPSAFMVDICGNIYISGWGGSVLQGGVPMTGMPYTSDAFQASTDGYDFYLMVLKSDFNQLLYATYLGGNLSKEHVDGGTSRFDKNGIVYQCVCAGCPGNSDFPTTQGAWSNLNLASNCNALTFKFDFNLIPKAEFTVDNLRGCAPMEINFANSSSETDTYLWDFGNGNIDSTTFEPVITYTIPGNYEVTLTVTDTACMITDTSKITIEIFPEINLFTSPDIDLCNPTPITLTAYTNGSATSFIWSSQPDFSDTLNSSISDSVAVVDIPNSGYYYILAGNGGCKDTDSVFVNFTSASLNISGNTHLCAGETTELTAVNTNPAIEFNNFNWSPESLLVSDNGQSNVTVQPFSTQYFYITATANNGCEINDSILVLVSNIDESNVFATTSENNVPEGGEVFLSAIPDGYSYQWFPDENLENPTSQETSATVYEPTNFTVLISDGICTRTSSVWVDVFPYICEEPYIYVPNAFTPNNDGENDILYVRSLIIQNFEFKIYNRWGEQVFESKYLHNGWDGTFRGKELAPDVYDYYLKGYCINNQEFLIKGNITLIR